MTLRAGRFELHPGMPVAAPGGAAAVAQYFSGLLRATRGVALGPLAATGPLVFRLDPTARQAAESYTIEISPDEVVLAAKEPAGLFYAAVTLWQLCTPGASAADSITLPALSLRDAPRFRWRGLLLDSARHFQSPQFILELLDWMALHKLNVLHWHLTDDQGWRLEIKKYPLLTRRGAWRVPAGAAAARDLDPATGKPRLYGGFYSQRTVRLIVAHARSRHITIVPEIDMPGHATAAIVAYPRLGTQRAPRSVPADWGVYSNLYNAEPETFRFLQDVLSEVIQLFPGPYVHLGGDEAVKDQWRESRRIQQRIRELGVTDEEGLQGYFLRRMGAFLARRGRRLIGWDEVLGTHPAAATAIMSWRGVQGAITAAQAGHDSILTPAPTLYFDNRQGSLLDEPPGRGRIVTLEEVYRFDPLPAGLSGTASEHVLGLQANIWTEHISTEERLQYMSFPRAAAVAELGWSPAGKSGWEEFAERMADELERYRILGMHAAPDLFVPQIQAQLEQPAGQVHLSLTKQAPVGEIHYTLDGTQPLLSSPVYQQPVLTAAAGRIRAATYLKGREIGSSSRSLDPAALLTRSSEELQPCTDRLLLALEDDAPLNGPRAVFLLDVMNPCWIYRAADLTRVKAMVASVGQVPFNFQLGAAAASIKLTPPRTPAGELEVRDGCEGELIASLALAPAQANAGVTELPRAPLAPRPGLHDLCMRFTQRTLDPLWVLDRVRLLE